MPWMVLGAMKAAVVVLVYVDLAVSSLKLNTQEILP
jgi:hypothetical protein